MGFISGILNRFKEPSSWAALATALFGASQVPGWWTAAAGIGSLAAAALGFFLPEKTS